MKQRCRGLQDPVPGRVPQQVVHFAEIVEVEEHDSDHLIIALGSGNGERQAVAYETAIGQAGQRIELRQIHQSLLGALALGNILDHGESGRGRVRSGAHARHRDAHP